MLSWSILQHRSSGSKRFHTLSVLFTLTFLAIFFRKIIYCTLSIPHFISSSNEEWPSKSQSPGLIRLMPGVPSISTVDARNTQSLSTNASIVGKLTSKITICSQSRKSNHGLLYSLHLFVKWFIEKVVDLIFYLEEKWSAKKIGQNFS